MYRPLTASQLYRLVPMDPAELDVQAEAAFVQWTALHVPRRSWNDLPEHTRTKYRLIVLAIEGTRRGTFIDRQLAG